MSSLILVIDDDKPLLDLYSMVLEDEGYRASLSMNEYGQLADIETLQPDLIILDIKLGHQYDGFLLLQKLRLYRPTKDIPIIVCTAATEAIREQEETFRQKHIPVIYKPFDLDELLQVIRQSLPSHPHSRCQQEDRIALYDD